jgi:hypothetical protein
VVRFIAAASFVLVFTTAAVCGDGKKAEPVSDSEFLWLATAAAKDANLTIDDFPDDWESEPQEPDDDDEDDDGFGDDLSPECKELFESFEEAEQTTDNDNPSAESDDFSDPNTREGVSTEVEVFRDVELAIETQEMFETAFDTCGDDIGRAIEEAVNSESTTDTDTPEFQIENLEMIDFVERDIGDWAADWGFSLTYDFGGLKVDATLTFTLVRSGRMAGTFFHFQIDETDAALIDSMRELFAERLKDVDATLPE